MKILTKGLYLAIFLGCIIACKPEGWSTQPSYLDALGNKPTERTIHFEPTTNIPSPYPTAENLPPLIEKSGHNQTLKVLFIGNSFTFFNNLPGTFERLMTTGGFEVVVDYVAYGGWSLSRHANSFETIEKIASTDWDYVVLQEQSTILHPETDMYPAIKDLNAQIKSTGAETILFITWGRKEGLDSAGYPDYESMQAQIIESYQRIAVDLNLTVAPIGQIWGNVLDEKPGFQLWDADGIHPSKEGTYLAALVFYAVLTQRSPEGLSYLAGLSEETTNFLQHSTAGSLNVKP